MPSEGPWAQENRGRARRFCRAVSLARSGGTTNGSLRHANMNAMVAANLPLTNSPGSNSFSPHSACNSRIAWDGKATIVQGKFASYRWRERRPSSRRRCIPVVHRTPVRADEGVYLYTTFVKHPFNSATRVEREN
eukprot:7451279-Pyramimonas_sp.AAC.3